MFGLCRTCMVESQQSPCNHSEKEREIKDTWVTLEVQKALEKGYKVRRIHGGILILQKRLSTYIAHF